MKKRNVVGGVALVSLGAAAAVATSHVQIHWQAAHAAPVVQAEVKPALPPPSKEQLSDARMLSRTFSQVASQLSPSVVRISITKGGGNGKRNATHRGGSPFEGTPFERFFGDEDGDGPGGGAQPKQKGLGSGVVIDKKGYILTNNHVVEDADDVKVSFVDGKTVTGKVVGTDPHTDIAVVKVDGVAVQPAKLGDSEKLQVGEWVIAIGNPFGLDHTVTVGVLSARGRSGFQGGGHFEDFLQTDASINPGNSGGPLVNLDGEVIGINTMIAGIGTGIGFAVPSSMFKPVADQLIKSGHVRRPYIGIRMQPVTPEVAKGLGKNAPESGALVAQIEPGSPADKAGAKPGDVITTVGGKAVKDPADVQRAIVFSGTVGQKVDLTVWRDGQTVHVSPTTAELPGDDKVASRDGGEGGERGNAQKAKLGLGLSSMTPMLAQRIGVDPKVKGAVITSVRDGSPAQEAGLQ
ncbi:MAG: trypsin-like peptidase domain-containing protein, partial [Myxococcales bacterium]|nr:trypsin-like peptidase domain-containing protein [Myxococcales bacterium]